MRILKIADVPRSDTGGASGAMLRNGAGLTRLGHEVDYLLADDLRVPRLSPRLRRAVVPFSVCVAVRRRHRSSALDMVEIHEPIAGPYAWLAAQPWARGLLPPCVVMSHGLESRHWSTRRGSPEAGRGWRRMLDAPVTTLASSRLALRRASHVLVLNAGDRDHLLGARGMSGDRVSTVFNGVDPELFEIDHEASPSLRVLFVGQWIERKGVVDLAAAWARIVGLIPAARLTVAGVQQSESAVTSTFPTACRSSLDVIPSFSRDELPDLLARHDVLVLPSSFEGMPLAVLEAAAAGLAIVASNISAHVEIFRLPRPEDDGALVVPAHNPDALVEAIVRLDTHRELLSRLKQRARTRARAFTWDASARAFETAFAKVAVCQKPQKVG